MSGSAPRWTWIVAAMGLAALAAAPGSAGEPEYGLRINGHTELIRCVTFSPDGTSLATAAFDGSVRVWDAHTGVLRRMLAAGPGRAYWVSFGGDGKSLVGGTDAGVLRWGAKDAEPSDREASRGGIDWAGALSPDGASLAVAGTQGRFEITAVRGEKDARVVADHGPQFVSVAWSPDGGRVAAAALDGTVRVAETAAPKRVRVLAHETAAYAVALSAEGRAAVACADGSIAIWDATTGALLRRMTGHVGAADAVTWSPDGRTLATGGADGTVRLWDAAAGTMCPGVISGHRAAVWSVAFSPDGSTLASAGEDRTVLVRPAAPPPAAERAPLPPSVDLTTRFPKWTSKGQFSRGSCSVHTLTRALEFARSVQLGRAVRLSDEYMNWGANRVVGNVGPKAADRGQFFEHLWMSYQQFGVCEDSLLPTRDSFDPGVAPDKKAMAEAERAKDDRLVFRIVGLGPAEGEMIAAGKRVLAAGWPVLAGGHHSILFVGYADDAVTPGGGAFLAFDSATDGGKGGVVRVAYARVRDFGLCAITPAGALEK